MSYSIKIKSDESLKSFKNTVLFEIYFIIPLLLTQVLMLMLIATHITNSTNANTTSAITNSTNTITVDANAFSLCFATFNYELWFCYLQLAFCYFLGCYFELVFSCFSYVLIASVLLCNANFLLFLAFSYDFAIFIIYSRRQFLQLCISLVKFWRSRTDCFVLVTSSLWNWKLFTVYFVNFITFR